MTVPEPADPQPSPAAVAALGSIDLSGGDETPASTVARVAVGVLVLLIGGVGALALFAAYLIGGFIEPIADWVDLLGDGLLYAAIIAFAIAVTGFELIRRGRKARAAEAAQAAEVITSLDAAGALDGTADVGDIQAVFGDTPPGVREPSGTQKPPPGATGAETHL